MSPGPMSLAARGDLVDAQAGAVAEVEAALRVPSDPAAAAFFDVDNTVLRGASLFQLGRGLVARDFFTAHDLAGFAWKQAKYVLGGKEIHSDIASVTELALAFIAGREVVELERLGEEVFDEYLVDKFWPGTLALAQAHLDAGQRVWLVTATPFELANVMAQRLGLTGALGTVSEVRDGCYTGKLLGLPMHGEAKAAAVRELAIREGLDLERCSAYSDSINDLPLLTLVGSPHAVNPDAELRRLARAKGWPVHDYRRRRRTWQLTAPGVATGVALGVVLGIALTRQRGDAPR